MLFGSRETAVNQVRHFDICIICRLIPVQSVLSLVVCVDLGNLCITYQYCFLSGTVLMQYHVFHVYVCTSCFRHYRDVALRDRANSIDPRAHSVTPNLQKSLLLLDSEEELAEGDEEAEGD